MSLELVYYNDPVLRKRAEPVKRVTAEVVALAKGMVEVMQRSNGLGLAAPQVGHSLRIFVMALEREEEDGTLVLGEPRTFINPELSHLSEVTVEATEGCLSIPGLRAPVVRPLSLVVEALDLQGERFRLEATGYVARCVLHETDHLNGVLFIDYLKGKRRAALEPTLMQIDQRYRGCKS